MTTVPIWAAILVSIGTPVLSFVGVLAAQFITRRSATELEVRSKREKTMRNLRWAAELADDPATARLGVAELAALGESSLLDGAQQLFVDAALAATVSPGADEVKQTDQDADIIELRNRPRPAVPSDQGQHEEGDDDA